MTRAKASVDARRDIVPAAAAPPARPGCATLGVLSVMRCGLLLPWARFGDLFRYAMSTGMGALNLQFKFGAGRGRRTVKSDKKTSG